MPVTVPPPDIDRRPRRTDENDGGHGRRPPNGRDLKRTGGGGDNDNSNESPGQRRYRNPVRDPAPREIIDRRRQPH